MKTFKQILYKNFKKLVPYKPLMTVEIITIQESIAEWLKQKYKTFGNRYKNELIKELLEELKK